MMMFIIGTIAGASIGAIAGYFVAVLAIDTIIQSDSATRTRHQ